MNPIHQVGALRGPLGRSGWGSAHQTNCRVGHPILKYRFAVVFHPITNFAGRHRSEIDAMREQPVAQESRREMLALGVHWRKSPDITTIHRP